MTMLLQREDVHVWLAFLDEKENERLHAATGSILSEEERQRTLRYHFRKDQCQYVATRILVRTVLSKYAAVAPEDWVFSTNQYGRPEIVSERAAELDLSFNVSHTEGLIVLAVTRGREIGVDVENVVRRQLSTALAKRVLTPNEWMAFAVLSSHEQAFRLFDYWTCKESYVKARGMGLSVAVNRVGFHYPGDGDLVMSLEPELNDVADRWQFWQLQPRPEFLISVCARKLEGTSAKLTSRQFISETEDCIVPSNITRSSCA